VRLVQWCADPTRMDVAGQHGKIDWRFRFNEFLLNSLCLLTIYMRQKSVWKAQIKQTNNTLVVKISLLLNLEEPFLIEFKDKGEYS